jgi:Chemoreceptor zinc-binding domain
MDLTGQIKAAIGVHGLWKSKLKAAIDLGESDVTADVVRGDRNCAFGKWLHSLDAEAGKSASCKTCKELHAKFHLAAASVLSLALAGKKQEALNALENGEFVKTSADLTRALMAWSQSAAA